MGKFGTKHVNCIVKKNVNDTTSRKQSSSNCRKITQ